MSRFSFIFILSLLGCTRVELSPYQRLHKNMHASEVLGLLGDPSHRIRHEGFSEWYYKDDVKRLTFVNHRLLSVEDDNHEYNRLKKLRELREKTRNDRPKIEIPETFKETSQDSVETASKAKSI